MSKATCPCNARQAGVPQCETCDLRDQLAHALNETERARAYHESKDRLWRKAVVERSEARAQLAAQDAELKGMAMKLIDKDWPEAQLNHKIVEAHKEIERLKVWSSDSHVTELEAKLDITQEVIRLLLSAVDSLESFSGVKDSEATEAREALAKLSTTEVLKPTKASSNVDGSVGTVNHHKPGGNVTNQAAKLDIPEIAPWLGHQNALAPRPDTSMRHLKPPRVFVLIEAIRKVMTGSNPPGAYWTFEGSQFEVQWDESEKVPNYKPTTKNGGSTKGCPCGEVWADHVQGSACGPAPRAEKVPSDDTSGNRVAESSESGQVHAADPRCQRCGDRVLVKTLPDGCCNTCHKAHISLPSENICGKCGAAIGLGEFHYASCTAKGCVLHPMGPSPICSMCAKQTGTGSAE